MSETTPIEARRKLRDACRSLSDRQIRDGLDALNMRWDEYTEDQRTSRAYLLVEWEARHGAEAVDRLMDELEGMID